MKKLKIKDYKGISAYARHIGKSHTEVQREIKKGFIVPVEIGGVRYVYVPAPDSPVIVASEENNY